MTLALVVGLDGHYAGTDDLGVAYSVNGGGLYWGARYYKSGIINLGVGEYMAGQSPEDALMVLKNCRETFVKFLFEVDAIEVETEDGTITLTTGEVPPIHAMTSNPLNLANTENAYRELLDHNRSGGYTEEIGLFWCDFMDRAVESL